MGMLGANMPAEITEYKEKFFMGLSVRQMVSAGACVGVIVMTYYTGLAKYIPQDIRGYVALIFCAPIAAFGFYTQNGMTFEIIALNFIRFHFIGKQKRIMQYAPPFMETHNEIRAFYLAEEIEEREREIAEQKALMKTKEYKAKIKAENKAKRKKKNALLKAVKKGNTIKQKVNRETGEKEKHISDVRKNAKNIKKGKNKAVNEKITRFSSSESIFDFESIVLIIYDFLIKDSAFIRKVKTADRKDSLVSSVDNAINRFLKTITKDEREIFLKYYSDREFAKNLMEILSHQAFIDKENIIGGVIET